MKNKIYISLLFLLMFSLAACNSTPAEPTQTPTPAASATLDYCSPTNMRIGASKVNELTRAFDDYSKLASNVNQTQLLQLIPSMQAVSRQAETQTVPVCLKNMKLLQLNYMNTVVNTLIAFMGNSKSSQISAGIAQSRTLHQQYDLEYARLLGITLAPTVTITPGPSPTPRPSTAPVTVAPTVAATTALPQSIIINPGPAAVNLRVSPDLNAGVVVKMDKGLSTPALGITADGQWILVQVPGQPNQKAWCYAALVTLTGKPPVVTP
jgi:hypothetical protein